MLYLSKLILILVSYCLFVWTAGALHQESWRLKEVAGADEVPLLRLISSTNAEKVIGYDKNDEKIRVYEENSQSIYLLPSAVGDALDMDVAFSVRDQDMLFLLRSDRRMLFVEKYLLFPTGAMTSEVIFEARTCGAGGSIVVGKDEYLYIGVADSLAGVSQAQNLTSLCGKVLRIRMDGTIPEDNPYYSMLSGASRGIYAIGFRNPSHLISSPTGTIFVQDAGPKNGYHEVNLLRSGLNYGWPPSPSVGSSVLFEPRVTQPLCVIDQRIACELAGGAFVLDDTYRGSVSSESQSLSDYAYLFADRCSGKIYALSSSSAYAIPFLILHNEELQHVADMTSSDGVAVVYGSKATGGRLYRLERDFSVPFDCSWSKRQSNGSFASTSIGQATATAVLDANQLRELQLQLARFLNVAPSRIQVTAQENSTLLEMKVTTLPGAPATAALLMTRIVSAINSQTMNSSLVVSGSASSSDMVNSTTTPAPPKPKSSKGRMSVATRTALIVGIIGGVAVLALLLIAGYIYCAKLRKPPARRNYSTHASARNYMNLLDEREMYSSSAGGVTANEKKPNPQSPHSES